LNKISGLVRLWTGYTRYSPGFEINDAGFLARADEQSYSNWVGLLFNTPRSVYRRLQVNFNQWTNGTTRGMLTNLGGNVNANAQLKNMLFVYGGTGIEQIGGSMNDRDARGGPAFHRSPRLQSWAGLEGDTRRRVFPTLNLFHARGDYGRSRYFEVNPGVEVRASSRLSASVAPFFSRNIDDSQWKENITDPDSLGGATHYTFAHLDQKTASVRARLNFTATPNVSLQVYAEPFVTSGVYSNWRELSDQPRSPDYEARFRPYLAPTLVRDANGTVVDTAYAQPDPGGFTFKQFRSTSVLRWEYRPGSTLFLVWTQGRDYDDDAIRRFDARRDARDLFRLHPDNTFLVKFSYWFSL